VEKTRDLVFHFRVPLNVLDDIEARYDGESRKWLDMDPDASWRKLVAGLRQIDMNSLARQIESMHIMFPSSVDAKLPNSSATSLYSGATAAPQKVQAPAPVPTSTSITCSHQQPAPMEENAVAFTDNLQITTTDLSSPISGRRVEEVRAHIEHFEKEFTDIKLDARVSLSNKERRDSAFLDRVRDHLLSLPVSTQAVHARFFSRTEDDIINAVSIVALFAILSRYCNYFNYDLILHIVCWFCAPALKRRMLDYQDSFETFEKKTPVDIYLCAISAHPSGDICKGFTRMVMKINKPASECMLHEVRQLKESIATNASAHLYSIYIESVVPSSVKVVLYIHPELVPTLTSDFVKRHQLKLIPLAGKTDFGTVPDPVPGPILRRKKVTIISAQNPVEYKQIRPPPAPMTASQEAAYQEEVFQNEAKREKIIESHKRQVAEIAHFLGDLGIEIVIGIEYKGRQLDGKLVPFEPQWLQQDSDYVVLVITPSLNKLLNENKPPEREVLFMGPYLHNLISGQLVSRHKKPFEIVCVFLNRPICREEIPPSLVTGRTYELWSPFVQDSARSDDLGAFISCLRGRNS
jgi:hypothetical protein